MLLLGAALVVLAMFLPVEPAVPAPSETARYMLYGSPALLVWIVVIPVLAVLTLRLKTVPFRGSYRVLALLGLVPVAWSVSYGKDALLGGAPVLAPLLYPIGVVGVVLGLALLAVAGPVADSRLGLVEPSYPRPYQAGLAAGAIVLGGVVAGFAWWIGIGSVDATTAERMARPAVPTAPSAATWAWETPEGQGVQEVLPAGAGVVVLIEDGIVALDGRTGQERWHYRWRGAGAEDLAVSPGGGWVVVSFASSVNHSLTTDYLEDGHAKGARVLGFDPMTGDVGFDEVVANPGNGELVAVTDHVLVSADEEPGGPTTYIGYDLRTGDQRWEYIRQWECGAEASASSRDAVVFGFRCGPGLLALDDRTGEKRWQFEAEMAAGREVLRTDADGEVVWYGREGEDTGIEFWYLFDAGSGRVLADPGSHPGNVVGLGREQSLVLGRDGGGDDRYDRYELRAMDGTLLGSVEATEQRGQPDGSVRATDQAFLGLDLSVDQSGGLHAAVEVLPWSGRSRRIEVFLGHHPWRDYAGQSADSDELEDFDTRLELAPGAVVVWQPDLTRIAGVA